MLRVRLRTRASFDPRLLCVPPISKMCANSFFGQSFMYAAPTLWNLILNIFMIFLFLQCVSTVIIVYIIISPLNSYFDIHWILDFKSILLLFCVS